MAWSEQARHQVGPVVAAGHVDRAAVITNADRLDAKGEMQVSVELILDGAAARIAAVT